MIPFAFNQIHSFSFLYKFTQHTQHKGWSRQSRDLALDAVAKEIGGLRPDLPGGLGGLLPNARDPLPEHRVLLVLVLAALLPLSNGAAQGVVRNQPRGISHDHIRLTEEREREKERERGESAMANKKKNEGRMESLTHHG